MPANLPPQYYELEREFRHENDPREKLRLAQELLRIMPKHKGTDHLQAEMKTKIAKLKQSVNGGGAKTHGIRQVDTPDHFEKEGAAQVLLIGPPNSGKSTLLDALTGARPLIGDYPFTTHEPLAGMMTFETIQIQLIDTPPIANNYMESYLPPLVRQCDLVVLVADVSLLGYEFRLNDLFTRLEEKRILLVPNPPVKVDDARFAYKKTIIAAHKFLDEGGKKGVENLQKTYPDFTIIPSSILDDDILDKFKLAIFNNLNIIRIYTKKIGQEADFEDPIILPKGGTVEDAALALHRDFSQKLQFARIWGRGKFEGQRVKNSYILFDGDIIEFHI